MKSIVALFVIVAVVVVHSAPVSNGNAKLNADNTALLARCRAAQAKSFAQETVQIHKKFLIDLKAASDPAAKAKIIKQQNADRLERTKLRLSKIKNSNCSVITSTAAAPIVVTTTTLPVTSTKLAAVVSNAVPSQ